MSAIVVCPLSRLAATVEKHRASDVLTLVSPDTDLPGHGAARHLKLFFNDISEPLDGHILVDHGHVEQIIGFVEAWPRTEPLVVHCWAGVSRSTAAAFVALCVVDPGVPERDHARAIRAASPTATPNRRIVALADEVLGREGRMVTAVEEIGRGEDTVEGVPFALLLQQV